MSEVAEAVAGEVQDDAAAMTSMQAGFAKARGEEPPATAVPTTAVPDTQVEAPAAQSEAEASPEPATAEEAPPEPSIDEQVAAIKAKIADVEGAPGAIRKLYGEIGNIQRTLKQMQAEPKGTDAPASDELAAALTSAEAVAEEFPEFAGPLVKAIKAMGAIKPSGEPVDIDARVTATVSRIRQADAIEALREEHPDYETVRETPEFKAWLQKKPAQYQEKLNNTWNPLVVSRGLAEFKESAVAAQANRQHKERRLEAAVTPKGDATPSPSKLPDSAGLANGYNKVRRLNHHT